MRVSKEAVDAIVEEINQIDINKIELDAKALKFLKTLEAYLHCVDYLEALYESIDPNHKLANYDLSNPNLPIQQVSKTGEPVKNIAELYEVAEFMLPVFHVKVNGLVDQVTTSSSSEKSSGVKFKLAPLKGKERAWQKAQDDYSKKVPGPPVSWLYDIDRGSLMFDDAEHLLQFLDLLLAEESIVIVKSKNRFRNPTLSGYRDFNMQIQITSEEDGSKHICELQLHITAIKEAAITLKSHSHYEFFRKFYSGATDSLEKRLNDLRVICKGGSLDMAFLADVVKNPLEVGRMTRLANLFANYMNEYQLAIVITNAIKGSLEPHDWYSRLGALLHIQDKLEEALALYQASLEMVLETFGPDHVEVAGSYSGMAAILKDQDKLEEAMKLLQKVLGIQVKALGSNHEAVAQCYYDMASLRYQQASGVAHSEAVVSGGGNSTPPPSMYSESGWGMTAACAFKDRGKLEEAMVLYKKALDISLKTLGPEDTLVAGSHEGMAVVLSDQGKFEEAMTLYQKALDIQVKAFGRDHTNVAHCYNVMASILEGQGKDKEAMKLYKKALDIFLNVHGSGHTLVGKSYYNMANILSTHYEFAESTKLYKKALDIQLKALGPDHTDVATTYHNMALSLLWSKGPAAFKEATLMLQKALDIRVKVLGSNHTEVAQNYDSVTAVLLFQGEVEEALPFAQKGLGAYLVTVGPNHPRAKTARRMIKLMKITLMCIRMRARVTKMCSSIIGYIHRLFISVIWVLIWINPETLI